MMQCPMCRSEKPNWENVDTFRMKPEGMSMCLDCGFISYPERYKTKQEIIDYYKNEYRNPPQVNNLYTGQRKLHYHSKMLDPVFKELKDKEITKPVITDIGAAFGMFLHWCRGSFPEADINGVELTTSFVRNAWHMYQIKLEDDFNDQKEYDLISSYKSLEHILDPDVELKRYIDSLKPGGYLYLSIPIWFRKLCNFGTNGWDIEYYYHTNHINVWNLNQFEALIGVCDGKIVEEDHSIYESTYLIQKGEKAAKRETVKQDTEEIKQNLRKIFAANEAFADGNMDEAINLWPNFPVAHTARYETGRKKYHDLGFDYIYQNFIVKPLANCQNDPDIEYLAADLCMRYNKYHDAIKHLNVCNQLRPNMPQVFIALGNCFRAIAKATKQKDQKINFINEARKSTEILKNISMQNFSDATTMLMFDNAHIPTPFEE